MTSVSGAGEELIRDIGLIRGCPHFPRNSRRNFAQYTSERPELISPWHAVARECGTKAAR
jgi:hypothetical protein